MSQPLHSKLTYSDYAYLSQSIANTTPDIIKLQLATQNTVQQLDKHFKADDIRTILKYIKTLPSFNKISHIIRLKEKKSDLCLQLHNILNTSADHNTNNNNSSNTTTSSTMSIFRNTTPSTAINHNYTNQYNQPPMPQNYAYQPQQQHQSHNTTSGFNTVNIPYSPHRQVTTSNYIPPATFNTQTLQYNNRVTQQQQQQQHTHPQLLQQQQQQQYNQQQQQQHYAQHQPQPQQSTHLNTNNNNTTVPTQSMLDQSINSNEFKILNRSPYEKLETTLNYRELIHGRTTQLQFSFQPMQYQRIKRSNSKPPPNINANSLIDIQLRLYDIFKKQHIQFDKIFRVKVNNIEINIPEPKKLNKHKQKGLQIVKPLIISDYLQMYNNTIYIDYFRHNYNIEPFRGMIVCEAVTLKDTKELLNQIKSKALIAANGVNGSTNNDNIINNNNTTNTTTTTSSQQPTKRECVVCKKDDPNQLLRCSACKSVWYCSAEHQREHWNQHRLQCKQLQQQLNTQQQTSSTNNVTTSTVKTEPGITSNNSNSNKPLKPKFDLTNKTDKKVLGNDDDILDSDDGIVETETTVSLQCPLSISRINCAAKGKNCEHLTCFDLETYLMYSEQSSIWQCAVCYQPLPYDDLVVDPIMNAVLKYAHEDTEKIKVLPDGDWIEINPLTANEQPNKRRKYNDNSNINTTNVNDSISHNNNTTNNNVQTITSNTTQQQSALQRNFVPASSAANNNTNTLDMDNNHFDKGGSVDDAIVLD